jgi:hypothetical protein
MLNLNNLRFPFITLMSVTLLVASCKKKKDEETDPVVESNTSFRGVTIDYNALTATTPYNNDYFKDANGDSTIDRAEGQNRLRMLKGLDAYAKTGNNAVLVSSTTLGNMFTNTASPFVTPYEAMNSVPQQLRDVTATSKTTALRDDVIDDMYTYFSDIAAASTTVVDDTAEAGSSGRLFVPSPSTSKYLVNEKGLELAQVISKSLIGAYQLDYIGNVLLNEGLNANNTELVAGKKYTALEHNWDVAYGSLTLNDRYMATVANNGGESFLAAYVWEYNKDGFPLLHPAFLKGRAAIINNDMNEVRAQAAIIRGIFEKAIAAAARGYMAKAVSGTSTASQAHAFSEGVGFVYSLRFCTLNGADEAFSDDLIDDLDAYEGNGFWDLGAPKTSAVSEEIRVKFGL